MVNRNSTKWVGGKKKKRKTERKAFILECNKTLDFFPPFIWRLQECNFQIRLQTSIYLISRYLLSLYVSIFLRKKKKKVTEKTYSSSLPRSRKSSRKFSAKKNDTKRGIINVPGFASRGVLNGGGGPWGCCSSYSAAYLPHIISENLWW